MIAKLYTISQDFSADLIVQTEQPLIGTLFHANNAQQHSIMITNSYNAETAQVTVLHVIR